MYQYYQKIKQCRLGLALALLVAAGCGSDESGLNLTEGPVVPVTAAPVAVQDISHTITQVGALRGNEEVVVKSEARGLVDKILFAEGAAVKAGDGLVGLDSASAEAQVRNVEAQLVQYRAELDNIGKTLVRKKRLLKGDVLSQQEFDDLLTRQQVGKALISQAESRLALARESLKDTLIRAPFDGIASARLVAVGDFIDVGTPLVTIVQVEPVKAELRIPVHYRTSIRTGMAVGVEVDACPNETFTGSIYFISPEVDPATRTFLVKALLPNEGRRLSPGMFARISIVHAVHKDALIVPGEAVVQLEDRAFVFAIAGGRARQVTVQVEKQFDDLVEVTGDLKPGEKVIIEGKFTVADGDRVAIAKAEKDSP